jgi:PIN domain nuclease of toxin-antitoxin system
VKLLLDTQAFLWFAAGDRRLSRRARTAMEARDAELLISTASIWEMAIKASLGRLTLPAAVRVYIEEKIALGYQVLPVTWIEAAAVQELPWHHRDPFDRLLVAQTRAERCPIVTRDRVFRRYGVEVIW